MSVLMLLGVIPWRGRWLPLKRGGRHETRSTTTWWLFRRRHCSQVASAHRYRSRIRHLSSPPTPHEGHLQIADLAQAFREIEGAVDRRLSRLIAWALRRWTKLDVRDYTTLSSSFKSTAMIHRSAP
jgi:hypothetical protein